MKRVFVLIFPILLYSQIVKPHREFKANGFVYDFTISKNRLYSATGVGEIDVFSLGDGKMVDIIKIPQIENFYGEKLFAKIYSVDIFQKSILILTEARFGGRTIFIYKDRKLEKIFTSKSPIKKVKFINNVLFLYATLGNELVLYDIWNSREIYRKQINSSPFSDFDIFESEVAISSESGEISICNIWTGSEIEVFKGENFDNVYKVAFENQTILGAGQDRKLSIYKRGGESSNLQADFLIYSVALSKNEKIGAFPFNQDNDIKVFSVNNGDILYTLTGQKSTLNSMEFLNNKTLFTSSNDEYILEWRLR